MTDNEMLFEALLEYEENNYSARDEAWQRQVNSLIDKYRARANADRFKREKMGELNHKDL